MADTMQFDLVSPERRLASFAVTSVQIPGADGDLTAMPDHAPLITTLRPGILRVSGPQGDKAYVVTGGFAQITSEGTSVLAEQAMALADVKGADIDALVTQAQAAAGAATADAKDTAEKLVADLQALRADVA
ncbi:MAG TPA: ATP synthase F1 subunit epsilon [Rhodobacteraceae bacterium]|jgi:F-type H+-transporting ATPase subunit epsilon|nr:ATP synthase F1 subunit epsilon [Paracoccaceae bacterium]